MFRQRTAFSFTAGFVFSLSGFSLAKEGGYAFRTGDVVFQSTSGDQAKAIRAATGSRYTHCGVVFEDNGSFNVLEATQPVKVTPLADFQKRSLPGTFHVRRLKEPLSPAAIETGRVWGSQQVGLNYDPHFRWDDQTLYCSELVWKVFKKAGVELCATKRFRDYELESAEVERVIKERYGSKEKMPQDEPVVSPGDLADSPLLVAVPEQGE